MTQFADLPESLPEPFEQPPLPEPPAYVKERIMARVHEESMGLTDDTYYLEHQAPVPALTRMLNFVPGYGTPQSGRKPARRHRSLRRTASVAMMFCLAFLASAYGYEKVARVVQKAEAARSTVLERVRHTRAFTARFTVAASQPKLSSVATDPIQLGHSEASLFDVQPEELAIRSIGGHHDAGRVRIANTDRAAGPLVAPALSETEALDLNSLEGALYFMSDRSGLHFSLRPVNEAAGGKASIYWNSTHSEALFTAEDLAPTTDDARYSLCYMMDDGTREQILAFEAVGGGHRQLVIRRTPGPHVVGAQLILESGYKSGRTTRDVVLAAASRVQNK